MPGWTWAHFQPTPPMSTYLVAFASSEFLFLENGTYRVWARPEVYQTGDYALEFAPKVLSVMENITGHKYTLPKMDQIGIVDFFSGAMENWGMLSYL
jgi:aminopeptidase N